MEIIKKGDIFECQFEYSGEKWEQYVLLMSDEHFDSRTCDRSLLKRHHEQAKERNAPIFKFGDVFDCMGGKYDPRSHKGDLRPEYVRKDYFDAIVKDAAKFYADYDVAFMSHGNHEHNVLLRHETDLIANLAERLGCKHGKYSGYLRFHFEHMAGGKTRSMDMYYNHGSGGNSPVTKGVIQTNRRGVAFDADIFVSGHNHNRWNMELMRQRVNTKGTIKSTVQNHINLGTYKDQDEWESEKGFPSPNKGGVWLRFYSEDQTVKVQVINA
jgi:hypothetical protein